MNTRALPRFQAVSLENIVDYSRYVIDEVLSADHEAANRNRVSLSGLDVCTVSHDADMAAAIDKNFATIDQSSSPHRRLNAFVVHPGVAGVSAPLQWDTRKPCHPQRLADVLGAAGLQASFFADLVHWHIYDRSAGIAVQLMRAPGDYPAWETGAPLRPFLHWHYALEGSRLTHCGTLGIEGHGVVLAGPGGSGKSGTVLAGLLRGMQSVGDDYVLLEAGQQVIARPLFATLKQDPSGFERLGLASRLGRDLPLNWQGKHQLRIQDVTSDPLPNGLSISALMVPQIKGSGRTEIVPVKRTEAMIALAASSIYQMPGERESGFRFFSEITRALPCFKLMLGSDSAEIADRIGAFIQAQSA